MHIKGTDSRERTWRHLQEATGESTTSGALDVAANHYIRMAGGTDAVPRGAVAEVLDTRELPVEYSSSWSVGKV